ncbi:MAG: TIGR01777 family oxidoreductase [Gemmatimonadales bacterium]
MPAPAETAFAWHGRPGAIERLTPPWERIEVIEPGAGLADGSRMVLRVRSGPVPLRWVARHRDVIAGRQFVDVQEEGPFSRYTHLHRFDNDDAGGATMTDRIEYLPPLGAAGAATSPLITRRLERLLSYRHELLRADLEAQARFAGQPPMRLAITGGTGMVGSALIPFLQTGGHEARRMTRSPHRPGDVEWNYQAGHIEAVKLDGLDGVVHLAGENIGARWTATRKKAIWESRAIGTRFLCETLARLHRPPRVLICASAIGIYGNRGDEVLTEESRLPARPADFLAEVCREWESATAPAREAGIRVVNLRFGIILTPAGGALARLLLPFRLGLGGPIGDGRQWMSWIGIDDVAGVIHHALLTEDLSGPVNATSPHPRTNREFVVALGRALHRPAKLPLPARATRLAFGEMGDSALLSSARVLPTRLLESGYDFRHPHLPGALRFLLGRATG